MDPPRFELTTPGLQDQSYTTELNLEKILPKKGNDVMNQQYIDFSSIFWQNFLPRFSSVVELWSCKPG